MHVIQNSSDRQDWCTYFTKCAVVIYLIFDGLLYINIFLGCLSCSSTILYESQYVQKSCIIELIFVIRFKRFRRTQFSCFQVNKTNRHADL